MKVFLPYILLLVFIGASVSIQAQHASISGRVLNEDNQPIANAQVVIQASPYSTLTDIEGNYRLLNVKPGSYEIIAYNFGLMSVSKEIKVEKEDLQINFKLESLYKELETITITAGKEKTFGITRLKPVEGVAIYAAKKTEVVVMDDITANLATNNARQVFAKVAGLNIWESDGAGIQLGIGARGLNPKRTTEFNTRQNGYDISADALGYPESYYSPPTEALDRIEIVRGAASLQYGTQFGGMINFVLKKGTKEKPIEVLSRQSVGSFGFFNSFNSIGGTKGKLNYYSFYQHKRGNEWRPNSGFSVNTGYANINYQITPQLSASVDLTLMAYNAQQPGGLSDDEFQQNPLLSKRERNWFAVTWNLASFSLDYKFSDRTKLNSRSFGLLASRKALGFLGRIDRLDPMTERDLLADAYRNVGNETRLLHNYHTFGNPSTFVVGTRYYRGFLDRKQGYANSGNGPDFWYLNPDNLEQSDYDFPSQNISAFVENVFSITPKFSITPGLRFEHILTASEGYYKRRVTDLAGNVLLAKKEDENLTKIRSFALFGLGLSYNQSEAMEVYANVSQNYRAINFNDIRVVNPTLTVNPSITDEHGYNADLGIRGKIKDIVNFDASLFYLYYNNRIGIRPVLDDSGNWVRTNIGTSRNMGLETFIEADVWKLIKGKDSNNSLSVFSNVTFLDAKYIFSEVKAIEGNKVELAPSALMKLGATFRRKNFQATYQYTYLAKQFTDAYNTESMSSAVYGIVPSYYVMDLSLKYAYKKFLLETGCNNLTNNSYFTRRADAYPGPGIIPAPPRTFYVTLGIKI